MKFFQSAVHHAVLLLGSPPGAVQKEQCVNGRSKLLFRACGFQSDLAQRLKLVPVAPQISTESVRQSTLKVFAGSGQRDASAGVLGAQSIGQRNMMDLGQLEIRRKILEIAKVPPLACRIQKVCNLLGDGLLILRFREEAQPIGSTSPEKRHLP